MYSQLLLHLKKHQRYRHCWFNLKKPGFTAKKGVTPNRIYYIQIHLRKYSGTNVALYLKRGKRYSKIQLKSSSIQKYQGIFKLQCNRRHKIYYLKVRTYIWQKGKRKRIWRKGSCFVQKIVKNWAPPPEKVLSAFHLKQ